MEFLNDPTRVMFFTGKGGVGKTSVACATAVKLADAGKRVLLISTDPASNLDEVLGVKLGNAPTGHTLRLLSLPSAWDGFLSKNTTGTSCLGPLAGLQAQQKLYADTVKTLGDPKTTTLVLVARPESGALREAERTSGELSALGIRNQHMVINGVFHAGSRPDPIASAMALRAEKAISLMPVGLTYLPRTVIPLAPQGLVGIEAIRAIGAEHDIAIGVVAGESTPRLSPLGDLIEDLARQKHGVILTMGKGGVGKTTVAAAVAVSLADRGFAVHLSTTDPATHVAETLHGAIPNLTVGRIDPKAETAAYSAEVMATAGKDLDAQGRAMLEEDLRSPCTEEIAVFRTFAAAVAKGEGGFVVLDTAPTGHTILLLDSALAYHREVTRQASGMPEAVENLLPRLRDPAFTRVLIVTLPEATPVHEVAKLQEDLKRAGIVPFAWVVNQCLTPLAVTDLVLLSRKAHEARYLYEVADQLATRTAIIPWQVDPPVGTEHLRELVTESAEVTALQGALS